MKYTITSSTDNANLGVTFELPFPILLGDMEFQPDQPPIRVGGKILRYFNSNYAIDVIEQ